MLLNSHAACAGWTILNGNTNASLRGAHQTSDSLWVSGSHATILRSLDQGAHWKHCTVPPAGDDLDFRAVWAFDRDRAFVLSSGPGPASRLYRTIDGCNTWSPVLANEDKAGFWDGLVFSDQKHGAILGDPVDGNFVLLTSSDGGLHWARQPAVQLNADPLGEGAFAGSNSSLTIAPHSNELYFGSGGKAGARLFQMHLDDKGFEAVVRVQHVALGSRTESSGLFSIAFRDRDHGVAVGGDFKDPDAAANTAIWTSDGGIHWHAPATPLSGYRSAVACDEAGHEWVAVGPNGTDVSFDGGRTWKRASKAGWNALSLPWAVGANGLIGRWQPIEH